MKSKVPALSVFNPSLKNPSLPFLLGKESSVNAETSRHKEQKWFAQGLIVALHSLSPQGQGCKWDWLNLFPLG